MEAMEELLAELERLILVGVVGVVVLARLAAQAAPA
jgi:hypothetical protein